MSDPTAILRFLPFLIPLAFVGFWLLITTLLGLLSGWFNLQQWYPDEGTDEPVLKLKRQSGQVGIVNFNNALTLSVYRTGLGIRVPRIFALFSKPLLIPWTEIEASATKSLWVRLVRLDLGKPANGKLVVREKLWAKLAEAAGPAAPTVNP